MTSSEHKEAKRIKPMKAWAIVDVQKPKPRWTYRIVNGKKSGVSIYFTKPLIPNGWRRKKKAIRVSIFPL